MNHTAIDADMEPASIPIDAADQREAPRFTLLIRTAKLRTPAGEFLCVIKDVSATGLSVRLFHPLPSGNPLELVLPNGDVHELECVWEKEDSAGFRFRDKIDIERLLREEGRFRKRQVRLKLQVAALISSLGRSEGVLVRNISQQGACIECPTRLAIDQQLRLEAEGLPAIRAKVRWRRCSEYGLVFEDTFRLDELARLASDLQEEF